MRYSDLGFDEYDSYLAGPEWEAIKRYFYEHRDGYECGICGVHQDLVLHKRSYKHLSLAKLKKDYRGDKSKVMRYLHTYMTYLCHACHRKVHFLPNGERTPLEYRKLKDREMLLKRAAAKGELSGRSSRTVKTKSRGLFLGSFFKSSRTK